jgi:hypothetical protein
MAFEEPKKRQSAAWGNGPYQSTETIADIQDRAVEALDPQRATSGSTSRAGPEPGLSGPARSA